MLKRQEEDFQTTNKMMCVRIFDGKEEITCDDYLAFRNQVQETLWHYEFHQFDTNQEGKISAYDFAQSLYVYYFPFHLIDNYLDHLSSFKQHKNSYVSIHQYNAFQYFLKQRTKILDVVMTKGKIDFDGLRQLLDEFQEEDPYCQQHGVTISDDMIRAFLDAMDLDGNGVLDAEEVIGILKRKKDIGSGSLGLKGK